MCPLGPIPSISDYINSSIFYNARGVVGCSSVTSSMFSKKTIQAAPEPLVIPGGAYPAGYGIPKRMVVNRANSMNSSSDQSNSWGRGAGGDRFIFSYLKEALIWFCYKVRAVLIFNTFDAWGSLDQVLPEIAKSIELFTGGIFPPNDARRLVGWGCGDVPNLDTKVPYASAPRGTFPETEFLAEYMVNQPSSPPPSELINGGA